MQLRLHYYLFYYLPKIYSILSYFAHFAVASLLAAQVIYSSQMFIEFIIQGNRFPTVHMTSSKIKNVAPGEQGR